MNIDEFMAVYGGHMPDMITASASDMVTLYDRYCLYDASMDAFFKIVEDFSINGNLDYFITWVPFEDSVEIVDMHVVRLQDVLRRALRGEKYKLGDPLIDRKVAANIVARCKDRSVSHLFLIPLMYADFDTHFITAIGANIALAEPLLEYTHQCPKDCPECGSRMVSTPLGTGCTNCEWRFV